MMRKSVIIALLLLSVSAPALSQTMYPTNQGTYSWTAVPPVQSTDTIKYQPYVRQDLVSLGQKVGGEVTETQVTISFATEGTNWVGVKTVRYPQGVTTGIESQETAWSSNAADCAAAGPFGFIYYVPPGKAGGLRRVP